MSERDVARGRVAATATAPSEDPEVVRDLVRRSLAGDDDAFAEIFRRHRERVFRIAFRFTRDQDEAMDLVQTAFIKVHRSLGSYREESSFATWIARIATNVGIDHVRARRREGRAPLDESVDAAVSPDAAAIVGAGPRGPMAATLDRELGAAIARAVDALSEKHRTVFTLHCVEGMPYQAIADTLQISIGTVMSRLFHARRYLRKSLAPYLGDARLRTLLKGQDEDEGRSRRADAIRGEEAAT